MSAEPGTPTPLTDSQKALIESRRSTIRKTLHVRFLQSPSYQRVAVPNDGESVGGRIDQRQVSFVKVAISNEGRALLDHWGLIEKELNLDPLFHVSKLADSMMLSSMFDRSFYMTVMSGPLVADNLWRLVRVPRIPSFMSVSMMQVWKFMGYVGGVEASVSHPPPAPEEPTP